MSPAAAPAPARPPTAVAYPVRTPPAYWVVVGAIAALALVGAAPVATFALRHGGPSPLLLALALGLLAAPALYVRGTREYRASGAIRLAPGSITVPDHRGEARTFAADRVRIQATAITVRFTLVGIGVGDLARGKVIDLQADGARRRISTLTLVDTDHAAALLEDLERILRGEAPRGPDAPTVGRPPAPADRYADQLERELRALD